MSAKWGKGGEPLNAEARAVVGGAPNTKHPTRKAKRPPTEKPVSKPSATSGRPGGADLTTRIKARTLSEYEPEQMGAISYGILMELSRPLQMETADVLPTFVANAGMPGAKPAQTGGDAAATAEWLREYAEEVAIGKEIVRSGALGKVLLALKIGAGQGSAHYGQAIRRAQLAAGVVGGGMPVGTGGGGMLPPLRFPTSVTSAFAAARRGANGSADVHRGVDLAAPAGSEVQAPANAKVLAVWVEDEGGQCMRLGIQRPDGGYAGDEYVSGVGTVHDDSGLLVTFAHLTTGSPVKEGSVVAAGDVVALSGNTGSDTTGPHLHEMVELYQDAPVWSIDTSNTRVLLDPVDVWGGVDALTGNGGPMDHRAGEVIDALLVPTAPSGPFGLLQGVAGAIGAPLGFQGAAAGSPAPASVVINNRGSMVLGNGQAVNTDLRVIFPLGELGSSGDGGMGGPPPGSHPLQSRALDLGGNIIQKGEKLLATFLQPNNVAVVVQLANKAAGAAGQLIGLGGMVASAAAPFAAAVPYLGPILAIGGPIASVLGPTLTGLSGFANNLAPGLLSGAQNAVQDVLGRLMGGPSSGPQSNAFNAALQLGGPFGAFGLQQ